MGRNGGNSRNGTRSKTVRTEIGPVQIEVPGTGTAPSNPASSANGNVAWTGDQIILSLSARGLTTGEIAAHFAEVYDATVSSGSKNL